MSDLNGALLEAVQKGDLNECERLLDAGAQANHCGDHNPLFWAVLCRHLNVCRLLIRCGADVNEPNSKGEAPLYSAAELGFAEVCQLLIESGANVDVRAPNGGLTPLMEAAFEGRMDLCRMLIAAGADVKAVTVIGDDQVCRTPLLMAAFTPHEEVLRLLLEHGASSSFVPANPPANYLTPFQGAVKKGLDKAVHFFMMECSEDPGQLTLGGKSMIDVAGYHQAVKTVLNSRMTELAVKAALEPGDAGEALAARRKSIGMAL